MLQLEVAETLRADVVHKDGYFAHVASWGHKY